MDNINHLRKLAYSAMPWWNRRTLHKEPCGTFIATFNPENVLMLLDIAEAASHLGSDGWHDNYQGGDGKYICVVCRVPSPCPLVKALEKLHETLIVGGSDDAQH